MYVCQLNFDCLQDVELEPAQLAITALLDEYRYNGQILGREFPVILKDGRFQVVLVCPEQDSLAPANNKESVNQAFQAVAEAGLGQPSVELLGLECQSDFTDTCRQPSGYIVYSTFVQSCSPVRCLEHFSPLPLYKLPESLRKPLIKWQESQAACDQLQMNELKEIEPQANIQLSSSISELTMTGRVLAEQIKNALDVSVYYYLYRVGGESLEAEQQRGCPGCGQDWSLKTPLHDLFDFKCDTCGLVSNISWDWQ